MSLIGLHATDSDDAMALMMSHQNECVQKIDGPKIYLYPEALQLRGEFFALHLTQDAEVLIPYLYEDTEGYFILCRDGYYYWECTNPQCRRAYSYIARPPKCRGCNGTSFRKVKVG